MHPDLFPNAGIIDSFFEYYFSESELGAISVIRFTPAVDYYTNIQHPAEFFAQIHKHLEIIANKYNNKTSIVLYAHRIKDLYKTKEYETCKASGFYIEISPNGDLYLCCEKFMCKQYIIGSILKDDIAGIYASAKRKAIIESVNQEKCSNCPTLCKPHEINKQINRLNCANQVALRSWKKELLKISKSKPYYAGKLNAFES
jgi:radical SAM protein with 4Fe4S-binding SPASM domain